MTLTDLDNFIFGVCMSISFVAVMVAAAVCIVLLCWKVDR